MSTLILLYLKKCVSLTLSSSLSASACHWWSKEERELSGLTDETTQMENTPNARPELNGLSVFELLNATQLSLAN